MAAFRSTHSRPLDRFEIARLIRYVVRRMSAPYFAQLDDSEVRSAVRARVLYPWGVLDTPDLLAVSYAPRATSGGSRVPARVMAGIDLLCDRAAADSTALITALEERRSTQQVLELIAEMSESGPDGLVLADGPAAEVVARLVSPTRSQPAQRLTAVHFDLAQENDSPVALLKSLVEASRRHSSGSGVAALYVTQRSEIDLARLGQDQLDVLALADQSIDWDLVGAIDRPLRTRLRSAQEELRTHDIRASDRHLGYLAHRWRGDAVLATKQGDYGGSIRALARGLGELNAAQDHIPNPHELVESQHQFALALAGAFVKQAEGVLPDGRPNSRTLSFLARVTERGVVYARAAMNLLRSLENDGLPKIKGDDGPRVATQAWSVQSRVILARAHLLAATVSAADVELPSIKVRRRPADAVKEHLDQARQPITELLTLESVTDEAAVVQLLLWNAFLNRGRCPLPGCEPPSRALRGVDFLCRHIRDGHGPVVIDDSLDISDATRHLADRHYGLFTLAALGPRNRFAKALDRRSGGRFVTWLSNEALGLPRTI